MALRIGPDINREIIVHDGNLKGKHGTARRFPVVFCMEDTATVGIEEIACCPVRTDMFGAVFLLPIDKRETMLLRCTVSQ